MRQIEKKYGEPIEMVLARLFDRHETLGGVAKELNLTRSGVSNWLRLLGGFWVLVVPYGEEVIISLPADSLDGLTVRFIE